MSDAVSLILDATGLAVDAAMGPPADLTVGPGLTAVERDAAAEAAGAWIGWTRLADGTWQGPGGPAVAPTADDLRAYARARSYVIETAGVDVNGVIISTERTSQGLIQRADALLAADPTLTEVEFDAGADLPETMQASDVRAIGIAVGRHVQKAFAARAAALRAIASGQATTREQVDAVLTGAMA